MYEFDLVMFLVWMYFIITTAFGYLIYSQIKRLADYQRQGLDIMRDKVTADYMTLIKAADEIIDPIRNYE